MALKAKTPKFIQLQSFTDGFLQPTSDNSEWVHPLPATPPKAIFL